MTFPSVLEKARYNLICAYRNLALDYPEIAVTRAEMRGPWAYATTKSTRNFHLIDRAWVAWPGDVRPVTLIVTKCGATLRRFKTSLAEPDGLEVCDECVFADFSVPTVYRCYDSANALLYVGSSTNVLYRIRQHAASGSSSAVWWRHVDRWTVSTFATLDEALAAENEAIQVELPLFNVKGRRPAEHRVEHQRPGPKVTQ